MGKVVAHCLHCQWEGPIDKLKRVPFREMVFLVCPKCGRHDFELEEKEAEP